MPEPKDMIVPMLRDMRDEVRTRFNQLDGRLDSVEDRLGKIEGRQKSLQNAMTADTMMSKIGHFQKPIQIGG